jgi:plastocyanin
MNSRTTLALGGLFVLVAALAACNGSSYNSAAPTATPTPISNPTSGVAADVTITITGMNASQSFSPNPGTMTAGQKVAWFNADTVTHTATADNGSFDAGNIAPGATSSPITMTAEGAFSYHCKIHRDMVGTLNVTPSQPGY